MASLRTGRATRVTVADRVTAYLSGVQERLRAAEIARAAESARAEEATADPCRRGRRGGARAERRARRFQVGLAASLLVLTTAGGLTFTYLLHQHQQRAARFAQVLAEATRLRDKARRDADDPAAWRDALAALERAEGQGPADRVAALRDEIQAGLDEAERDARLRQELVEVRANQQDAGLAGTDAAYATAFRTAELDLDALEPAEFARRLRRQPEAVVVELSAFLDDWSAVRREAKRPVAAWRRPLEAARLADPDPYRDRLRTILLAEDRRPRSRRSKAPGRRPRVGRPAGAHGRPAGPDPGGQRPGRGGRGPASPSRLPPPRRRLGELCPGRGPGPTAAVGPRGGGAVLHGGPRRPTRDVARAGPPAGADGPRRRGRGGLPRSGRSTAGERAPSGLPGDAT